MLCRDGIIQFEKKYFPSAFHVTGIPSDKNLRSSTTKHYTVHGNSNNFLLSVYRFGWVHKITWMVNQLLSYNILFIHRHKWLFIVKHFLLLVIMPLFATISIYPISRLLFVSTKSKTRDGLWVPLPWRCFGLSSI